MPRGHPGKPMDRHRECARPAIFFDRDGTLHDITTEPAPVKAQISLQATSDDLVALVDGDLNFASSWARGRVKLEASFKDLLTLRKLV